MPKKAVDPAAVPYMHIGEVAERTGLTQRTIRFYEEKGLLRPTGRVDRGFRRYVQDDIDRIEHIVELRSVIGFSIDETKHLLDAEDALEDLRTQYKIESDVEVRQKQLLTAIDLIEREEGLLAQKSERLKCLLQHWQYVRDRCRDRVSELDEAGHSEPSVAG